MTYIELDVKITPYSPVLAEILTARLADIGYESFSEHEQGFYAYISKNQFQQERTENTILKYQNTNFISLDVSQIKEEDWNKLWESQYSPVTFGKNCIIKAPFHQIEKKYKYEIIIAPKMSFGTGHHASTALVIEELLEADLKSKTILDMGCGTGILSILASKLGAEKVTAIDIDEWAYQNCIENVSLNKISNIEVLQGSFDLLKNETYDVVVANITKNVILENLETMNNALNNKGVLILSGFYNQDVDEILSHASQCRLQKHSLPVKENWACIKLINNK
mgnify:CR=1 FL=1